VKKYFAIIAVLMILMPSSYAKCEDFTKEDRDRLIRLEVKFEEGQKALQRQIDDLKSATIKQTDNLRDGMLNQVDDLKTFLFWGFGILFGGMGILIGFVIWDRRTALEPVARKNRELEEREEKLEKALKEYARLEPKLAEILKSLNL